MHTFYFSALAAPVFALVSFALAARPPREWPGEARRLYAEALKMAPNEASILNNLGLSYLLTNELPKAEATLRRAGSDPTRLLQVTLYLADMDDYDAMNAVWDNWVPEGTAPARACVQACLANPEMRVEVVVIAAA